MSWRACLTKVRTNRTEVRHGRFRQPMSKFGHRLGCGIPRRVACGSEAAVCTDRVPQTTIFDEHADPEGLTPLAPGRIAGPPQEILASQRVPAKTVSLYPFPPL